MDTKDPLIEAAVHHLSEGPRGYLRGDTTYVGNCPGCGTEYQVTPGSIGTGASMLTKAWGCMLCGGNYVKFRED